MTFEPIAIVGRGCILPDADSAESFWDNIMAGRTALGRVPDGRWKIYRGATERPGTEIGGYVRDFDPTTALATLGIDADRAELLSLDRVFLWTIVSVGAALADSGQEHLRERAGLVLGNLSLPTAGMAEFCEHTWLSVQARNILHECGIQLQPTPDPRNRFMSGLPALLAARLLGLGGGGYALDAACASALYAVKLACDRLQSGRCDLMLAGGVNAADNLYVQMGFTALSALSPTGRSLPFDWSADGLVPGEGAVVFALMRLDDAVAARASVYGVIRGIGLSNDGCGGGLLAPHEDGQVRAMARAYDVAGITPATVGLLECHGTGTPVGDAAEIRSTARIFADHSDLSIGSVKSNIGHLLTAAGGAGMLKMLEALRHAERPPTPGIEQPTDLLADTPLRLLRAAEPWPGRRRGAVSAFGFGGNNAHVILDAWDETRRPRSKPRPVPAAPHPEPVAIVGVGARVAGGRDAGELWDCLLRGTVSGREQTTVELDMAGLRFPPEDLAEALAQQTLLLEAAREAARGTALPSAHTMVIVGMGCDPEVARHIARWRAPARVRDAFASVQGSATVLGALPNVVANRVNAQLDLVGPSFVVSAEEASGMVALELGVAALCSGEADAVLAGAVDLSCEPVHQRAVQQLGQQEPPGDAAVVMLLKRLADARRDGDQVLAVLDETTDDMSADLIFGDAGANAHGHYDPSRLFGRAHAAHGLLVVAAAAFAVSHRAVPRVETPAVPALRPPRAVRAEIDTLHAGRARVTVRAADRWPAVGQDPPRLYVYTGQDRAEVADALATRRATGDGPAKLVIVACDDAERATREESAYRWITAGGRQPDGAVFRERPLGGEVAFVYSGGAMAYPGMGRELLLAFPDQLDIIRARCGELGAVAQWAFQDDNPRTAPGILEQIWGAALLGQLHTEITRGLLGINAHAAIGYSSGESTALTAFEVWRDIPAMMAEARVSPIFTHGLTGRYTVVEPAWRAAGIEKGEWASYLVNAPVPRIRAAVAAEPLVHMMVINSPDSVVIGGEAACCWRVVRQIGETNAVPVPYEIAVHIPELEPTRPSWRRLHRRAVYPVAGTRFYSGATCGPVPLTSDDIADAMTAQSLGTVDFAETVRRAFDDGVRVFIEHGPRGLCSSWIQRTLNGREHLAVALDAPDGQRIRHLAYAAASIAAAGVAVDIDALNNHLASARHQTSRPQRPLTLSAHPPAVRLPDTEPPTTQPTDPAHTVAALYQLAGSAHQRYLSAQTQSQARFVESWSKIIDLLAAVPNGLDAHAAAASDATTGLPATPARRAFTRADLERHARGRISEVFGPQFAAQDRYDKRVRLPAPPLLLVDRVTDLVGEPMSLGTGAVNTETTVAPGEWYLDAAGRMAAGPTIEAGQAGLLLLSWLGIDVNNYGQRVYRLLGCEVTFHGHLPVPGETLRFDIRIEGHQEHDGVQLFFFRYDCRVSDALRLSTRKGQAGFFTEAELAATTGLSWNPTAEPPPAAEAIDPPHTATARTFTAEQVLAFTEGRMVDCFGPGWARTRTHIRTPRTGVGQLRFLREILVFDPAGGPWGTGYLRARTPVSADDWYFAAHFHNDPCMPGNLMFEGCLQAMAFYLTACGLTIDRDGWRFEIAPNIPYPMRCRGQATPSSRELSYEVYATALSGHPEPTLTATVLVCVDGIKAFLVQGLCLRLTPDWPLEQWRHLGPVAVQETGCPVAPQTLAGLVGHRETAPVGESGGVRYDYAALLACAWGRPTDAFGRGYAAFDSSRHVARLPGPPYHFMSRVTAVTGPALGLHTGSSVVAEYDIPAAVWFFEQNDHAAMPLAVLLEVVLQAGGWLASYVGSALDSAQDLYFRNLDGNGQILAEVTPAMHMLRTTTTLVDIARSGHTILETFEIVCAGDGRPVCTLTTTFGFFTRTELSQQIGVPSTEQQRRQRNEHSSFSVDLATRPDRYFAGRPRLPGPMLLMLSRVTGFWPDAGVAGLGRLRAEKDVDAGEWFFKAHFFQDPVQPGSLGVQAICQLLQFYMIECRLAEGLTRPRFEPVMLGRPLVWKYRGQVIPETRLITIEVEITEVGLDGRRPYAAATGWLWADDIKIYHVPSMSVRITDDAAISAPADDG